ncbi:protein SZT2 [Elysia marginata]|uniref:Protein SZT2 n=1 Tax=Elysia marginata TaxID=1093978 RepID=A0AAV4IGH4_9GAST|nr:protein SZT2 [Elysia marginata]
MIPHSSADTPANGGAETSESAMQGQNLLKVEAAQVYVQMKKNTRVSRNIRACWFFKHLRQSVKFTPPTCVENLTEELTLVSVIPKDPEVKLCQGQFYEVFILPETNVTFLSSQYRLSFTLDLSPSLMSVDIHNGEYIYNGILKSLSRCLRGLVAPVPIPGTDVSYCPDLYISVICHTPVVCSATNQWQQEGLIARLEDETDTAEEFKPTDHMGTPEAGFTNMLRYGILALQLLPDNSSSGIIVITDGIVGLPSSFEVERLLNQLRNHTIMCSFIKVGSSSGLYKKLCHVPHIELMQAIATATFGAYLGSAPDVTEELDDVNLYHRAMLFWSFQRGLEGFKYDLTHYSDEDMPGSISWIKKMLHRHPITLESFGIENLRKEREKRLVRAGLHNVLAVRLREGYTLKSIYINQDHREIQVKMHFPWRDYGKIEYTAVASWPLEKDNLVTNIEVAVEGSYDLLHDMLCKPTDFYQRSPYRVSNVKTLWTILDRISSTDHILEKLQSFSSQPTYYMTPERIRSGVPLFYMQQDGPSLNMQLQGSDIDRFASFWKDVIQLKTSTWQKWLHSHRIGLVLEHDRQFPKYFQVPNASSRFTSIQCRQAVTSLSLLLREWSTFVLAENHSYIKFLHLDQDKPPQFFCVLRLTSKAPNMIIRLGFLGGTPASTRLAEIAVLTEKIRNLSFPHRGTQKVSSRTAHSTSADSVEDGKKHKSPLSREGSEIACCVLLTKPVEKILVIYESRPSDMQILRESVHFSNLGVSHPPQDPMRSTFRTITHYLQHQRWIWTIQASKKVPLSMSSVSRLLSTITKLRLQEGFNIAVSSAGITNLVLEVDMKEHESSDAGEEPPMHTCVVQYIVFPPHTKTSDDSMSEDDQGDAGGLTEADAEVQIVTECWLEPQYGICCNNTPERQHFNGLNYMDIAKAVSTPCLVECSFHQMPLERGKKNPPQHLNPLNLSSPPSGSAIHCPVSLSQSLSQT